MVHTDAAPVVHLPPGIEAFTAGKGMVEEYDSPDYDGSGQDLPGSPPPRESLSFSAHYDELFELSTDSDDELEDDHRPLDSEEYRRIAVDCANAVLHQPMPHGEEEGVDAAIYEYCATANAGDMYAQGSTWTSVSAGEDPAREAAHWREVAEQGFRESARLRAMVQALRATFEEVEDENEELHVAYAMQQREILTLGHHLEFKSLETETLIANFERAMEEMDDTMEDICIEALQADAAAYAREMQSEFDADAPIERRERTDWKKKAAGRFAEKKEELAASNTTSQAKKKMANAGTKVSKLRKEVQNRAAEVKNDSPSKLGKLGKLGRGRKERNERARTPPRRERAAPEPRE